MIIKQFRKKWFEIAQLTLWLIGLVATFVLPPEFSQESNKANSLTNACLFVSIGIIALVFYPIRKFNTKADKTLWYQSSIILFIIAIITLFSYQYLINNFAVDEGGQLTVTGTTYTPAAIDLIKKEGMPKSNKEFLMTAGGDAKKVWTKESIGRNKTLIIAFYIFTSCSILLFLVAILQYHKIAGP